jgi:hypothetical protein
MLFAFSEYYRVHGRLAQLAEQLTLNQSVQGSSPWSVIEAPVSRGLLFLNRITIQASSDTYSSKALATALSISP